MFKGKESLLLDIIGPLEEAIKYSNKLKQIPLKFMELNQLGKELAEKLAKSYLKEENITLMDNIDLPVKIKKSIYLSLDFGGGYVFDLDSAFFYSGVNIYAVPVNKQGALRIFQFGRWMLKRTNLLIGVTNGMVNEGNYSNLFGSGNLIIGGGFRISKSFKINGGILLFKEAEANPLIDKTHIRSRPFISFSFDSSWQALIGKLSNLF